jgi:hypothetical protein
LATRLEESQDTCRKLTSTPVSIYKSDSSPISQVLVERIP